MSTQLKITGYRVKKLSWLDKSQETIMQFNF